MSSYAWKCGERGAGRIGVKLRQQRVGRVRLVEVFGAEALQCCECDRKAVRAKASCIHKLPTKCPLPTLFHPESTARLQPHPPCRSSCTTQCRLYCMREQRPAHCRLPPSRNEPKIIVHGQAHARLSPHTPSCHMLQACTPITETPTSLSTSHHHTRELKDAYKCARIYEVVA